MQLYQLKVDVTKIKMANFKVVQRHADVHQDRAMPCHAILSGRQHAVFGNVLSAYLAPKQLEHNKARAAARFSARSLHGM